MFRISTVTGKEIGFTNKVLYIKVNKYNGCFNECAKKDAIGIAFRSTPYNLYGHSEITGADTVIISEVDEGAELTTIKADNAALIEQLAEADEAAIQLYEANLALEEATAEQDEAIIEIYEKIGELTNG